MSGIIIVGGGQAAVSAAAKLKALHNSCPIIIIGEEAVLPYQRPPLSKDYLLGRAPFEQLLLRPAQWYSDNNIEVLTSTKVVALDRSRRGVTLSTGESRSYEKLILATGATPRPWPAALGGNLSGIHILRSKADVDSVASQLGRGRRLLVVGGGYIGLEVAAVATSQGVDVTLVEADTRILNRVASRATAEFIRRLHETNGARIRESVGVESFAGRDGRVAQARLTDSTSLDIDFAIVGIGVTPNIQLARDAGLNVGNGILVDSSGRTSDPNIFAVGDCAAFPYRGETIRLECVQNAIEQAEVSAENISGRTSVYDPVPWFWSDQYQTKLQIAGLSRDHTDTVVRHDHTSGQFSVWYFAGERFQAVDAINDSRAFVSGRKLLERGLSPPREVLSDLSTDLVNYVRTAIR
ncbi:Rhodocoxin reductase [Mesorhizobium plurifarium]|uniref:Rhodocoxin reductase n=1 Tax=Mesorhizobium plurifarium TaxID=69974 RepID=A0A090DBD8_MESPL|nr:Rhodocoxin reductase [Mesorhizobium plurifarium]